MNWITPFLALVLLSCDSDISSNQPQKSPPNILFLLADDMRYDLFGENGNAIIETPHLDRLAENGYNFQNNYVTTSICSVSRASILSGQYARSHKLWGFGKNFSDEAYRDTYPQILRNAGYYTGFIGKWGVGSAEKVDSTFDYFRGFSGQGTYDHQREDASYLHLTEKIGNEALEFFSEVPADQPFNLSISFKAPHVKDGLEWPFRFDPAYAGKYDGIDFERPITDDPEFYDHFPFDKDNEARERYRDRFETEEKYQRNVGDYYRLVHGIDVQLGRMLHMLEDSGQLENTIILFTSDNGFYLGEYGFAGKWYGSEPSIKTPLVVYDGRRAVAKKVDGMSLNIDLAATMLSLAGIDPLPNYQGVPLFDAEGSLLPSDRSEFLYEHLWPISPGYPIPSTEGIVNDSIKYMRYYNGLYNERLVFEEMYDLRQDPNETKNLALLPEMSDRVASMRNRTDEWIKKVDK